MDARPVPEVLTSSDPVPPGAVVGSTKLVLAVGVLDSVAEGFDAVWPQPLNERMSVPIPTMVPRRTP
jgi:hypothetical protein